MKNALLFMDRYVQTAKKISQRNTISMKTRCLMARLPMDDLSEKIGVLAPITPAFDCPQKDLSFFIRLYYEKKPHNGATAAIQSDAISMSEAPNNNTVKLPKKTRNILSGKQEMYLYSGICLLDLEQMRTHESHMLIEHYVSVLRKKSKSVSSNYWRMDICFIRLCSLIHLWHKMQPKKRLKRKIAELIIRETDSIRGQLFDARYHGFIGFFFGYIHQLILGKNLHKELSQEKCINALDQLLNTGTKQRNIMPILRNMVIYMANSLSLFYKDALTNAVKKRLVHIIDTLSQDTSAQRTRFWDMSIEPGLIKPLENELLDYRKKHTSMKGNIKYFPSEQSRLMLLKPNHEKDSFSQPSSMGRNVDINIPWNLSMHFRGRTLLSDQPSLPQGLLLNNSQPKTPELLHLQTQQIDGHHYIELSHNGYVYDYGITHERKLFLSRDGDDLRGEDTLKKDDMKLPNLELPFHLVFNLPKSIHILVLQSRSSAILKLPDGSGWQLSISYGELTQRLRKHSFIDKNQEHQNLCITGLTNASFAHIRWSFKKIK